MRAGTHARIHARTHFRQASIEKDIAVQALKVHMDDFLDGLYESSDTLRELQEEFGL